jgi:hypothetical protein
MTEKDARAAYHGGVCDDDVKALCTKDYIKEQLKNISKEDIQNILDNYGCDYDEDSIADMQECLIWLAAGDIVEDK